MTNTLRALAIISFGLASTAHSEVRMLTNQQAWTVYQKYVDGWAAVSSEERHKIADDILDAKVQKTTPSRALSTGRHLVIEDMESFQKKFPGGHFDIGDVSAHHDVALLTWILVQADGKVFAKGHDQIRISKQGKISSIVTFAPPATIP